MTSGTTAGVKEGFLALDLAFLLDRETRILPAAMMLCNELQNRLRCGRVSFAWVRARSVKVTAISNLREFDQNSELVGQLAHAMEECALQDEEIAWPSADPAHFVINREHSRLAAVGHHSAVLSIPLRWKNKVCAILTLERSEQEFTRHEILSLRLAADLWMPRLIALRRKSEFFPVVWTRAAVNQLGMVFGLEWLGLKLIALLLLIAIPALFFIPWQYRVEAVFTLRTETLLHVTAPYDGYIASVEGRIGNAVNKGDLLLSMDTRELALQRMEVELRLKTLENEIRNAQSSGRLAEAGLTRVKLQEESARLELTDFRLSNAQLAAPQEGVIVEGDLLERIGAAVSKGEVLFKITRVEDLYLRLELDERDIHEITTGASGEFALASDPDKKYPFVLAQIDPSAVVRSGKNVFFLRGDILAEAEPWWRPEMSGVAKIDVGERSLMWVLTHRLVDYVRLKLWI